MICGVLFVKRFAKIEELGLFVKTLEKFQGMGKRWICSLNMEDSDFDWIKPWLYLEFGKLLTIRSLWVMADLWSIFKFCPSP